jgi:hypothetical protein
VLNKLYRDLTLSIPLPMSWELTAAIRRLFASCI